jgi:hypothetical protein
MPASRFSARTSFLCGAENTLIDSIEKSRPAAEATRRNRPTSSFGLKPGPAREVSHRRIPRRASRCSRSIRPGVWAGGLSCSNQQRLLHVPCFMRHALADELDRPLDNSGKRFNMTSRSQPHSFPNRRANMKAKMVTFSFHGDTTLLEYDPASADMEEFASDRTQRTTKKVADAKQ